MQLDAEVAWLICAWCMWLIVWVYVISIGIHALNKL